MSQAAISQATSTEHWQARALELAAQRHLTGTARMIGLGPVGQRVYKVLSRTFVGLVYVVSYFHAIDKYHCGCSRGCCDKACSHAGAAIHAEQQRASALRETGTPSEEWRWWMHTYE